MTLTIGSLFAGIGGFDLAGEHYGWRTSWFVEWDASCRHWLAEHFPGRPIYGDITQVDFTDVEPVDILCGGFPCQPASAAGKRLGTADDRWLWPHFARAIGTLRPRYVVAENVPGLVSVNGGRAFAEVLRDLARIGYDAEWDRLSAGDVGSPQERDRVWIVAYANDDARERRGGQSAHDEGRGRAAVHGGREARPDHAGSCSGALGDTSSAGREERFAPALAGRAGHATGERRGVGDGHGGRRVELRESQRPELESAHGPIADGPRAPLRPWAGAVPVRGADGTVRLLPREAAEQGPESPLWPVADGLPGRVARLRAIGNTVVPQCVIDGPFRVIAARESAA